MHRKNPRKSLAIVVLGLMVVMGVVLAGCAGSPTLPPFGTPLPTQTQVPPPETGGQQPFDSEVLTSTIPGDAAKAVDLIGAWVEAGVPETDPFEYTGFDGGTYKGNFE